jgi:hypothetical protein
VIDAIRGGDKVSQHARVIGWPQVFLAESVDDEALQQAFEYCLTAAARGDAARCRDAAIGEIERLRRDFIERIGRSIEAG